MAEHSAIAGRRRFAWWSWVEVRELLDENDKLRAALEELAIAYESDCGNRLDNGLAVIRDFLAALRAEATNG